MACGKAEIGIVVTGEVQALTICENTVCESHEALSGAEGGV